jgi:hypothetical protein
MLRIFGSKRDEIIVSWRKFHEELHNLYSSSNMSWGRRSMHRVLVETP